MELVSIVRDVVRTGKQTGCDDGRCASEDVDFGIPDVGHDPHPNREHTSVVAVRHFDVVELLARVNAGGQVLHPIGAPDHRERHPHRDKRDERLLTHEVGLVPKASPRVGRDDPDLVLGYPGHLRQHGAQAVRLL